MCWCFPPPPLEKLPYWVGLQPFNVLPNAKGLNLTDCVCSPWLCILTAISLVLKVTQFWHSPHAHWLFLYSMRIGLVYTHTQCLMSLKIDLFESPSRMKIFGNDADIHVHILIRSYWSSIIVKCELLVCVTIRVATVWVFNGTIAISGKYHGFAVNGTTQ